MSPAASQSDRQRIPAPPGGHALRIDPRRRVGPGLTLIPSSQMPIVEETSAGGLVIDVTRAGVHRAAVIARRNRAGRLEWCLPKGHLEGTETPEQAAVREIAEETGISGAIRLRLGIIDYWFSGEGRRVHKVVHHFLLEALAGDLTVELDPDGEAEDAAWIPVPELARTLSYPNERRLAAEAQQLLNTGAHSFLEAPGH